MRRGRGPPSRGKGRRRRPSPPSRSSFEGRRVRFTDGREDEVDHVLWCIGYRTTVPFLDLALVPDPARLPLCRHVFPLDDDALSFVGLMQSTGSALPVVEAQSQLLTAYVTGRLSRPSRDRMLASVTAELHAARERWDDRRPHMRIDVDQYLRQVARDLKGVRKATPLAGRRVLVTGAAGTFGRALGARFTELGARVVGLDLHADASAPVPVAGCDLTDPELVTKGFEEAVRLLGGGVDVLVNKAGRGGPAPAELRPSTEVHAQLALNLLGAWDVTAAALPHLERARGRAVFIASRMAVLPLPLAAAYGVSKRALAAYADTLRLEAGTHVGVTTVYPSMVRSPIHDSTREAGLSLDGVSRPEPLQGVVSAVVAAVTARRAPRDVATTRRGRAEMALARHAPSLADLIVLRTVAARVAAGAFAKAPLAEAAAARAGGLGGRRRGRLRPGVVRSAGGVNAVQVAEGPLQQRRGGLAQGHAHGRERVTDVRRHDVDDCAGEDAVAFQAAQSDGEHALADAGGGALEFGEAARALAEVADDEQGPLVADDAEDVTGAARVLPVRHRRRAVGCGHGYLQGTGSPECALLPQVGRVHHDERAVPEAYRGTEGNRFFPHAPSWKAPLCRLIFLYMAPGTTAGVGTGRPRCWRPPATACCALR
ncbi:SDR family NAD(P)-dependent oxidoreductase [Streptomyces coelicolor]|nr:SDR family NAD(P)-dependent oxidoreductase [Streptomyces coelicolor]